jgi:hypothetical protein
MNAFEAAEKNGRAGDLQKELEALFSRENKSPNRNATSIRGSFLRGHRCAQLVPEPARHRIGLSPTNLDLGDGGADRDRTGDLSSAIAALSQLSYGPIPGVRYQVSDIRFQGASCWAGVQPRAIA